MFYNCNFSNPIQLRYIMQLMLMREKNKEETVEIKCCLNQRRSRSWNKLAAVDVKDAQSVICRRRSNLQEKLTTKQHETQQQRKLCRKYLHSAEVLDAKAISTTNLELMMISGIWIKHMALGITEFYIIMLLFVLVKSQDIKPTISFEDGHVVIDNGIIQLTLSNPDGHVTGIAYKGVENILETRNAEHNRGYWDVVWDSPEARGTYDLVSGTEFRVINEDDDQVEVSFQRIWNESMSVAPLNIDKRFIVLRGSSGFYSYAIYEHLAEWPNFNLSVNREVFKLNQDMFHFMAIADNKQRMMPMPEDRTSARSMVLAYPEAVLLTDPVDTYLRGEVDDKYQYSTDVKDNKVHGWISTNPSIGFWLITPSDEFRIGGPSKQELTSHVGPTTLSVFVSSHYGGKDVLPKFRNEYWKKVFGPIFIYLNALPDPNFLWLDAKQQANIEMQSWPYYFPASVDYQKSEERGSVSGTMVVLDRFISNQYLDGQFAFVGLALPGEAGSWQTESKGYQFWTRADAEGHFFIGNIRTGIYNLYAWVPGFIGDSKATISIIIESGSHIDLGTLVYEPPRHGPTLWDIGIPDRSAAEFFVPDPNPDYVNKLYVNHPERFRQYGLWERYTDLYPDDDLIYTVGTSDYTKDWFFAHVTRKTGQMSYSATTWQIKFQLGQIDTSGLYKLQIALASAHLSELQVRFNDQNALSAHFTTRLIGRDNSIARHGIHGLYWLFSIDVQSNWLVIGENTIYLTQSRSSSPFQGIMYDYIRMEEPPED